MIFGPALDCVDQRLAFVAAMLHRFHGCAAALQQSVEQRRIALVNLARLNFLTRLYQLVTGRNDPSLHFAAHRDVDKTLRRQQSSRRCANLLALSQDFLSLCQIATTPPDEFAMIDICIYDNLLAVTCDIFLHDDRVGATRDWRARKNPDCVPGRNTELPIRTGGLLADHAQPRALLA